MNEIIESIKEIFANKGEIQCISRLFHKNIVFYIKTEANTKYAFKLFYNGNDKKQRFYMENNINQYLKNNKIINVPDIIKDMDTEYGQALILEWIQGISIKSKLKKLGLASIIDDLNEMLLEMTKIWEIDDPKILAILPVDKIGLNYRINKSEREIFTNLKELKPEVDFQRIIAIYYELKNNVKLDNLKVINSDVSAHEFIYSNGKYYWLDFERYRLGDPNNDLARCFYSLASTLYNNPQEVDYLFELFKNNKYFQIDIFLYYFIEKLLNNIYMAPEQIDVNEINYFINYAILLYNNYLKGHSRKVIF